MTESTTIQRILVIRELGRLWEDFPEQRLGQLITNLTRDAEGVPQDCWEWSGADWLAAIIAHQERN